MRRSGAVAALLLAAGACGGAAKGDLDAFCDTARGFAVDNPAAAFAAVDPTDPAAAAGALRAAAERLGPWAEDAPDDVDDDVEAIVAAAADLADALAATTPPEGEARAALEATSAEAEGASARVTAFVRERCGVDLDPGAGATPPAPPTTPPAPS